MTTLTVRLGEYLSVRRSFGRDLSTAARVLRRFTAFADASGAAHVTVDLFLRWKNQFGSADNDTWAARLGMVRGFAQWLQNIEPRTEVPPAGLISGKPRRARPYIYSEGQIEDIVKEAAELPSVYGLRGWTYATLFGLIAASGLRINEALKLDDEDVDLTEAVLHIKRGKNGRSRFVPLSPCTAGHLRAYRTERNRILGACPPSFFLSDAGARPTDCAARFNFAQVCQNLGLRAAAPFYKHGRGPRVHDLRHTFAVRTIINWYRKGLDPDREMHKLSTYLGHAAPENTYWYIEAVPELLQLASERAERALAEGGAP